MIIDTVISLMFVVVFITIVCGQCDKLCYSISDNYILKIIFNNIISFPNFHTKYFAYFLNPV